MRVAGGSVVACTGANAVDTVSQSISAGSMPGAMTSRGVPNNSSLIAPTSGYLTPLPHTSPYLELETLNDRCLIAHSNIKYNVDMYPLCFIP